MSQVSIQSSPLSSPELSPPRTQDRKTDGAKPAEQPGTARATAQASLSAGSSIDACLEKPFPRFDHTEALVDPYHAEMNRDIALKEGVSPRPLTCRPMLTAYMHPTSRMLQSCISAFYPSSSNFTRGRLAGLIMSQL